MASLAVFLVIVFGVAFFGARFTTGPWYEALAKPSWTPPNAVFGPVWTVLYGMVAVAGWLVWRAGGAANWKPLLAFGVQLVLNGLWSWFFFGLHRPELAFVDILALWTSILITMVLFRRVPPGCG
jgi:benzodiazapine receptor